MPQVSTTDIKRAIKYLNDAATVYDHMPGQRNVCRAWSIRQLVRKLSKKLQSPPNQQPQLAQSPQSQNRLPRPTSPTRPSPPPNNN